MTIFNENMARNSAAQAALDLDLLQHLKLQATSTSKSTQRIVTVALEALDQRYGGPAKVALEAETTFLEKVKAVVKKIIEAIINAIESIIASFNRYHAQADLIIDQVEQIEGEAKGHVRRQTRAVRVDSNQLATTLFLSKGSNNIREAYRRVLDIATRSYDSADYGSLERILHKLQTATDDQAEAIREELLKVVTAPVKMLLTNHNPPAIVADRNTRENSSVICAGPFLGERYLYAYVPKDGQHLNEFHIGIVRDHDVMVQREKLIALSTADIWDVCQRARKFAEMIMEFGDLDVKLKKLISLSKDLIKNIDSPKVVSAAAVYPVALQGLHHSALNMGVNVTNAMLEYCDKSIKAQIAAEAP